MRNASPRSTAWCWRVSPLRTIRQSFLSAKLTNHWITEPPRAGLGYSMSLLGRISEMISAKCVIPDDGGRSSSLIILLNGIYEDTCQRVILYSVVTGKEETECCASRLSCRR